MRPSCDHRATCENSREAARAEKNGEGGHNAGNKSGSGKAGLQQAELPIAQRPGCPGGTPQLVYLAEVPGATLDAHRLHAASVLFCKCGLPPYSRVVPVDASSHALAM